MYRASGLQSIRSCSSHRETGQACFRNEGGFFDGRPDDYILGSKTPRRYRNSSLAQAMTELNMIDTMGYGIHSMHTRQAERYLPMPDYDLSETNLVRMAIYGTVFDPAYTTLLMQNTSLPLSDILALDRIQKGLTLPNASIKRLRRNGMIEGRKPNLHVSAAVAAVTGQKADYIRNRAVDDVHYARLITEYIE